MYTSKEGIKIHADVNGSYNIIRKVFPDMCCINNHINGAEGAFTPCGVSVLHPSKVNILEHKIKTITK